MWAVRRPAGSVSRNIIRSLSGYGRAILYPEGDEQKLRLMFRRCHKRRSLEETMAHYDGKVYMDVLEESIHKTPPDWAMRVYQWGKSRQGFAYTPRFVKDLISALRFLKRTDDIEEVISEMAGKADAEVERIARSMLYVGYVRAKDRKNAERVKAEIEERGQVLEGRAVYQLLDLTLKDEGPEAMLAVYKEHFVKGMLPDAHGYHRLIAKLGLQNLDEALQMFKESGEKGVEHGENTRIRLISQLLKQENVEEAARVALGLLIKAGSVTIRGDAGPVKLLIAKLVDRKSYDDAFKLLKMIIGQEQHRSAGSQLMEALIKDKELDRAMELVELMKERNIREGMNYSLLIRKLCKAKRVGDARYVLDTMVEFGLAAHAKARLDLASCDASSDQSE